MRPPRGRTQCEGLFLDPINIKPSYIYIHMHQIINRYNTYMYLYILYMYILLMVAIVIAQG